MELSFAFPAPTTAARSIITSSRQEPQIGPLRHSLVAAQQPRRSVPSRFSLPERDERLTALKRSEGGVDVTSHSSRGDGGGGKKGWVHFVGIGGCGLSALAMLALKQGFEVSGSDIVWSSFMNGLHEAGARLFIGHSVSNLQRNSSSCKPCAVVISSAISADNVEVLHSKSIGVPIFKRDGWLGKITERYTLIAISGTHGKSTTTAMLSYVLDAMGHDITAVVGACVPQFFGGNIISGGGPKFILEADEYDGCFLGISPLIAVVTNVEWEHVDYFEDEKAVKKLYRKFLTRIKDGGHLILCGDSAGACSLVSNCRLEKISGSNVVRRNSAYHITTYGTYETNEWHASSITLNAVGGLDYVLYRWEQPVANISLQLPGIHNVLNSLAVIAAILALLGGRQNMYTLLQHVQYHLHTFKGISRRFEMIGKVHGCYIYDDYAHHPTEIRAVLQAARQKFPNEKLWVIFQPHTFSRLATFMKDFASALSNADYVIVTEVYAARETNAWNVSGRDLSDLIVGASEYIHCLDDVVDKLVFEISSRSIQDIAILTLGAGDITTVGRILVNRLERKLVALM